VRSAIHQYKRFYEYIRVFIYFINLFILLHLYEHSHYERIDTLYSSIMCDRTDIAREKDNVILRLEVRILLKNTKIKDTYLRTVSKLNWILSIDFFNLFNLLHDQ